MQAELNPESLSTILCQIIVWTESYVFLSIYEKMTKLKRKDIKQAAQEKSMHVEIKPITRLERQI